MSKPIILEVHEDMSNEKYHSFSTDWISSSFVKNTCKHSVGYALEQHKFLDPANRALIFGSAFHTVMEEDGWDKLNAEYYWVDDSDVIEDIKDAYRKRTGKEPQKIEMSGEYKKWLATQGQPNKELLTMSEYRMLHAMYESANRNEFYRSAGMLREEVSYFAEWEGMKFRVRPDFEFDGGIIDYKTCGDVTKFPKDFFTYQYDVQAVFYSWILDIDPSKFYFLAVEKQAPYHSQVFNLSDERIEKAKVKLKDALYQIRDWQEQGITFNQNKPLIQTI